MNSTQHTATNNTTRREFLKTSSKVVAAAALTAAIARPGYTAEDNTIRVALIGCGGRGTGAAANALATTSGPIKLVAMADVFADKLNRSYEALASAATKDAGSADQWLMGFKADQIDVPPDRRFLGFDAYQKAMDCLKPGDVVILTTPVAFRWVHFALRHRQGPQRLHGEARLRGRADHPQDAPARRGVGEEEPQGGRGPDVPPLQSPLGTPRPHPARARSATSPPCAATGWWAPAGFTGPKPDDMTELLYQIQRYLGFMWASGGVFHDFVAHNVDECCWMKDAWPVRAEGLGARCYRGGEVDQNFDHYSVEYTYADGTKLFLNSRYMPGCHEEFASYAHGTKGSAVISTFMHTPAKCRIFKGQSVTTRADMTWAFPQPEPNPYQLEWDHLIDAIRQDKPFNEAKRGTEASPRGDDGPQGRAHRPDRHLRRHAQRRARVRPRRGQADDGFARPRANRPRRPLSRPAARPAQRARVLAVAGDRPSPAVQTAGARSNDRRVPRSSWSQLHAPSATRTSCAPNSEAKKRLPPLLAAKVTEVNSPRCV